MKYIYSNILELTDTNFKFSLSVDKYEKIFNLKIDDNRFQFSESDLSILELLPKIFCALLHATYSEREIVSNFDVEIREGYPLRILTHLMRRYVSTEYNVDISKGVTHWYKTNETKIKMNVSSEETQYNDKYKFVLPISGGKDSMLVYFLIKENIQEKILPFICNYGGYRWSLFEKKMATEWLPSKGINPIIVNMQFNGVGKLYVPFLKYNNIMDVKPLNHIGISWIMFLNQVIGSVFANRYNADFIPAIEKEDEYVPYIKNDGMYYKYPGESQHTIEVMKELLRLKGIQLKISSPIIMLSHLQEWKNLHKLDKGYRDIITSCGFGKKKWCGHCVKCCSTLLRMLVLNINPEEYGMDSNLVSKNGIMLKPNMFKYRDYIDNHVGHQISDEEIGYLHWKLLKGSFNKFNLPDSLVEFIKMFSVYKDKRELMKINKEDVIQVDEKLIPIIEYLGLEYNFKKRKEYKRLSLKEKMHYISEVVYKKKECIL